MADSSGQRRLQQSARPGLHLFIRSGGEEVFELFSLEKRNREKVDNNAVRCFGVTSCVEETKAQSNRSTPVCQWAFERCKSHAENDLRTITTGGRRQPGRRGAGNNRAGSLRGSWPRSRNPLQENTFRQITRTRQMPIVVARRSNRETIGRIGRLATPAALAGGISRGTARLRSSAGARFLRSRIPPGGTCLRRLRIAA